MPNSHTDLVRNGVRPPTNCQSPLPLPHPKPAPVRPLASLLPIERRPISSPFAVFELPNEIFLSILSYISPEPRLTGHYARFRVQYCMQINDDHYLRVQLLRPLSMTCKVMRLRLNLWRWDLIEPSRRRPVPLHIMRTIGKALRADPSLATSVKYLGTLLCPWVSTNSRPLKVHDVAFPVV